MSNIFGNLYNNIFIKVIRINSFCDVSRFPMWKASRVLVLLSKKRTRSARINIAHGIFWSRFFRLPLKFHLRELPPGAANDNIFGRARFSQWDSRVTSGFSIITKYIGRILFRTMHPAYINNRGIHLSFFARDRVYSRSRRARDAPLKISGNFPGANLELSDLFFSGARAKNQLIFCRVFTSRTQSR